MLFKDAPPVDKITGFFVLAIFCSKNQSLISELATLIISIPSSTHHSTALSSKAVAMGIQPDFRIALIKIACSSFLSCVFSVFQMYLRSPLPWKSL